MAGPEMNLGGRAFLFSFPFWMALDLSNRPQLTRQEFGGAEITIYPPFRSAPNNFVGMPEIKGRAIPFQEGVHVDMPEDFRLVTVAALPSVPVADGKSSVSLVWGDATQDAGVEIPMDSLRIDVYGDPLQGHRFLELFLVHLRLLSRQWWIGRSIAGIFGYTRNEFSIGERGVPKELPIGTVRFAVVGTDQKKINNDLWMAAITATVNDEPVKDYVLMNMDAKYYLSLGDLSACVINLATACETAKDEAVEMLWSAANPGLRFRRGKVLTGYDLPDHITGVLARMSGRDFRAEMAASMQRIEDIWDARGNVAHGGKPSYRRDGKQFFVDDASAHEFVKASDDFLSWIEALR